ncbi:hypothetical protein ABH995_000263 [Bradyrhizobium yuanmingense]
MRSGVGDGLSTSNTARVERSPRSPCAQSTRPLQGRVSYPAALSPNASANSEYDFFRAAWSYTAVITISSSGLLA